MFAEKKNLPYQTTKRFNIEFQETRIIDKDRDSTKLIVTVNLQDYNGRGYSKELLDSIISQASKDMKSYRIFHGPNGLIIEGEPA